jgi:hypothetical protein
MHDAESAREVGEKDEARFQAADQDRLATRVIPADLLAELLDPRGDLVGGEIDLAYAAVELRRDGPVP